MASRFGTGLLIWMSLLSAGWADVTVENPWARASFGPNSALFMTLVNPMEASETLIGAQIGGCDHVELHNHIETHGIFRMVEVKEIVVPGRCKVELKPGGYHLMLMALKAPLLREENVSVTLFFKGGKTLDLVVPVKTEGVLRCCDGG